MGMLVGTTDHRGLLVGKVALGQPARDHDADGNPCGDYRWDDAMLPNGVILNDGTVVVDEMET